jgi:uncharacterized membrane protein YbhN (UPF0104 family)
MTRQIITGIFYISVIGFLAVFALSLDFQTLMSFEINWLPIVFATALAIFARFVFAFIWRLLLSSMGAELSPKQSRELLGVYGKAWLGRYLPGSATWVIGKIYFASNLGVSKTKLAVSSIMEAMLQLVIVIALAAGLLVFDPQIAELGQGYELLLILVALLGLLSVYPKVFNRLIGWVYQLLRKTTISNSDLLSNRAVINASGLFALTSVLNAVSLLMVALAFDASLFENSFLILGVASLASAVSILVVIAPAGIGVREGIQILGLGLVTGPEMALAITVMMRLFSIIWDLVFYFVTRLMSK